MKRSLATGVMLAALAGAGIAWGSAGGDLTTDNTGRAAFNQPFAFIKDDAALITANGRIVAGRNCVADVRQQYSGAKGE